MGWIVPVNSLASSISIRFCTKNIYSCVFDDILKHVISKEKFYSLQDITIDNIEIINFQCDKIFSLNIFCM